MNMFKKNGGFTLVELIVVIAILAILAGVAVPVYSGYISKAQEASDLTQLDSLKTAVVFATMDKNPNATVTKIVVTTDSVTVTADPTVADINFAAIKPYFGADKFAFASDNDTATWENTGDNANKWVLSGEKAE